MDELHEDDKRGYAPKPCEVLQARAAIRAASARPQAVGEPRLPPASPQEPPASHTVGSVTASAPRDPGGLSMPHGGWCMPLSTPRYES
ncbi:hypothetical protein ABZ468_53095 [Streptomyces sp. NPDC005708]|uniref:hypothetical protein n=1 Tax=unclassified Streptomyces TaxID=2593676 RepID=UPI0034062C3E